MPKQALKPEPLALPITVAAQVQTPTEQQYSGFSAAYSHFNETLFNGQLPGCLITLQRRKGAYGYFSPERFATNAGQKTDEIAMNPQGFVNRTVEHTLSTLVHEMAHLWEQHFGKPAKGGYHGKGWAAKMKEVGLYPSTTAAIGGKETGQSVSHYIIENGVFAKACAEFLKTGFVLYGDPHRDSEKAKKKAASKTKYTCGSCECNAWAKPDTRLVCGDCEEPMIAED